MDIALDGTEFFHDILTITFELPNNFALEQNYPNPFNPETVIPFQLPVDTKVTVEIFNVLGQKVKTLVNGELEAGYHAPVWNGSNDQNTKVASGMYFVVMHAQDFRKSMKIMMLK